MTNEVSAGRGGAQALWIAVAVAILTYMLHWAQSLVVPFLLSIFIAIIAEAPVEWLRRKRVPTAVAVLLVVLLVMGLVALTALLVGSTINEFSERIPVYRERLNEDLGELLDSAGELLGPSRLTDTLSVRSLVSRVEPGQAMNLVSRLLNSLSGVFANTFLILFTVVFLLIEASAFPAKLRVAFGESRRSPIYLRRIVEQIKRYLSIKTVISGVTGVIVAIWVTVLGVDFALLWGLIAFLFNYIPNIGSILAAIPAVLLAFVQLGWVYGLVTAAGYVVINVVVGNFVEPRVMGRGLGLSTLVVFLSLVFWGWVLGPVGMLLSAPLTMTVKIALEDHESTRWIAILLGSGEEAAPPQAPVAAEEATSPSTTA